MPEVGLEPTRGCPHRIFESDKDCGMARDAALRGAFMSLLAFLCGIVRVLVLTVTKGVTKIIPAKLGSS